MSEIMVHSPQAAHTHRATASAGSSSSATERGSSLTSAPDGCGFDIYRLDCVVDALRDAHLTTADRAELARIAANLADIMEPMQ